MIVYLDASAIVKRYLAEAGSAAVNGLVTEAAALATSLVSRAEVSAALAHAARLKALSRVDAEKARRLFAADWVNLIATPVTQSLVAQADALAWEHSLRGYDAVHLASAVAWHDALGEPVTLATFDRELWQAARAAGLDAWPELLESMPRL